MLQGILIFAYRIDKMKLYHYSNKKFEKFEIGRFGENPITKRDKMVCQIPRVYFYTKQKPEKLLRNAKFCYECEIALEHVTMIRPSVLDYDIHKMVNNVLEQGYDGWWYNDRENVVLFRIENVKILERRKV